MALSIRDNVFRALDHAVANGYEAFCLNDPLDKVARDLADYDADLFDALPDDASVDDLTPHIEAWRKERLARAAN